MGLKIIHSLILEGGGVLNPPILSSHIIWYPLGGRVKYHIRLDKQDGPLQETHCLFLGSVTGDYCLFLGSLYPDNFSLITYFRAEGGL